MKNTEQTDKGQIGEDLVNSLAEKSYLQYWCFPNPKDVQGDNKEICDLLILFFDVAIIISVKNYMVNGNYEKFLKKVIEKSSNQLFGAERKLFKSHKEIILEHNQQGRIVFDANSFKHIFKITVSVGEDFEKYEFIDTHDTKGIVNIFNKETFEIVFSELDTIKDLTEYLKAREYLLEANKGIENNCSEKDLLAYYLMNNREFSKDFSKDFSNTTKAVIGKWEEYRKNKSVFLKKLEEQKSYFIDKLVNDDVLKVENGILLAKEFMTLSRFERRILASNLFEVVERYENEKDFLGRRYAEYNGIGFLFVYYPIERTQREIDMILKKALQLYSYYKNQDKIVLLAASKGIKQWKFGLFQATEVDEKAEIYLKQMASDLGWFKDEKRIERRIDEYPKE